MASPNLAKKTIDELSELLELRSQNNMEKHVEEVRKWRDQLKIGDVEYNLSDTDTQKKDIPEELKRVKYNDLEDLVYRMQLTNDDMMDILDLNFIPTRKRCFSLNPGICEVTDLNKTLKYISPDNVKVSITIEDIRRKSNLSNDQTLKFTRISFSYKMLGFSQSHLRVLDDIEGFIQIIPGTYKSNKPIKITGVDKVQLQYDCTNGSIWLE